ncbi:MAG: hypothetical protein OXD30_08825 [Bryobacterales bacterium]|nr:hypothetical protein [Bryobacterales bacterium]
MSVHVVTWLLEHRLGPLPVAVRRRFAGRTADLARSRGMYPSLGPVFNGHGLD